MPVITQQSPSIMNAMLSLLNNPISGMPNRDLENIAKKCVKNFKGVYPSDSFPQLRKNDFNQTSIIFNLSPHNEEGSHFVAVFIKHKKCYYFDSFGKPCKNKLIKKFLNKFFNEIFYSSLTLQHEKSILCSFFCLSFLLHMQNPKNRYDVFLKIFSACQQKNDKIVLKLVQKQISMLKKRNKNSV